MPAARLSTDRRDRSLPSQRSCSRPSPWNGSYRDGLFNGEKARSPQQCPPSGRFRLHGILGSLGILFVSAGVGIVQHIDLIRGQGGAILAVVLGSTVLALTATAFVVARRLVGGGANG
ncbi:MAG: CidA/LrgA family protein [Mesorhizobium sp.]|nr:MAG: CidA/LrgA family protein [Mesorhizobium sp.]TIX34057.1 MAG: CidA/LrgA family protein [Mesorhizobium sp.]